MMELADREALLERLATAQREIVFLVGSPLTAPTGSSPHGVPGVAAMVQRIKALFQKRPRALNQLEQSLATDPNPYQAAFRHVLHFRGPDAANSIIRDAVLEARLPDARPDLAALAQLDQLENDLDGWHYPPAVAALGELVARHGKQFGGTLLTTNFDPLIELSIRRRRGRAFSTVLHGDGSLGQSRGEGCHVVHAHGYWHGIDALHTPTQLGQDRPQLRASLARLFRNRTLVVLAYGGWDDIFTRTLQEVAADQEAYPDVLWCFYDRDPDRIVSQNAHLFEQLRPAIGRQRAIFYTGIDCHTFLPDLLKELDGTMQIMNATAQSAKDAPARDDAAFIGRQSHRTALKQAFDAMRSVQLIGPRRMGKSSLLRWMERDIRAHGQPVVFVNARGLAGRSPSDLVLAVGEALDKRVEVKSALYAESALPGPRAAEKALQILLPLCLLVDEAEALTEKDHGFDAAFFERLQAFEADKKLSWISASEQNLFDLFAKTGMTSAFLENTHKLYVGALSQDDAEAFLHDRLTREHRFSTQPGGGSESSRIRWASQLVGGFPPALTWIADRLTEGQVDLQVIEQDFWNWIQPLFQLWWQKLDPAAQQLLRRSQQEDLSLDKVDASGDRSLVRLLMDTGFLREEQGKLRVWGRAWQQFIAQQTA